MAFMRSLFAGVSGLQNMQLMMDVIGNNISNINTVGFKESRTTFGEAFAQTLRSATQPLDGNGGMNAIQVGLGMSVNTVDTLFTQGNIESTGQSTDMAIQGSGFFAVNKNGKTYYTRVGTFQLDANGRMVNPGSGAILQGKLASSNGTIPAGTKLEDLKIALDQKSPAKATSVANFKGNLDASSSIANIDVTGNLNSDAAVGDTAAQTFSLTDDFGIAHTVTLTMTKTDADTWSVDVAGTDAAVTNGTGQATFDPATGKLLTFTPPTVSLTPAGGAPVMSFKMSYDKLSQQAQASSLTTVPSKTSDSTSASVTVYDSAGNPQTLTLKLTKSVNANEWTWSADLPSPANITAGQTGKITFNTDGSLRSFSYDDGSTTLKFDPNDGAAPLSIDLKAGTASSFTGITQFGSSFSVTPGEQDGYTSGSLSSISIDPSGIVKGSFSNGNVIPLGQVMLVEFNNPAGLMKSGENLFDISGNSGTPAVVEPGNSSSVLVSGALEQSNVDLAEEFTRMITAQRGFQSVARVITTSDEFLQEVVNLKR
jgi:flagellar hook protein FlgE